MHRERGVRVLLLAGRCWSEAFSDTPAFERSGAGLDPGGPMQFVDPSDPGAGAGLNELALGIVPLVCRFRSLEENQELCDRGQISGWRLHSLRGEGGPTADAVAGWVRRGALLRSVAEICPQAVLLLLARHVESLLLAVEIREAGVAQLRYGLLKAWLSQGVFPQQPWELRAARTVVRGWGLVEREARIFGTYGRLLSQIHS
ncbi:unnamed protein product [Prorocentrum cordatum]|uniref:General transcription factor IIH subunit 4 n=1 Tax=Prorocentrum cordatum TaxID=2364126 RepID=A0ABN9XJ66_9DINO|nr:unnamed protein product [Polarella glacialis]